MRVLNTSTCSADSSPPTLPSRIPQSQNAGASRRCVHPVDQARYTIRTPTIRVQSRVSPTIFVPIALTTPPTPERREVARKVASMTLAVALLGVVVLTVLTLILLRRARGRAAESARARRTRHTDAWAEAGRRAGSPPAEAFEPDSPILPDLGPDSPPQPPPKPSGEPHG